MDDNECSRIPSPCLNNGTCVNNVGSYKCSCTGGFVGTNCEKDVDECVKLKPCQNSAVCINNKGSVVVVYLVGPYNDGPNFMPAPLTPVLITPVSKIRFPQFRAGVKRAARYVN